VTRVASFDVFDTVLTRLLGGPRQVFVETGRRLAQAGVVTIDAEAFAAARERAVADLTPDVAVHPTLERIDDELASRLGLPAASVTALLATELDVERDVCRAVPGAVERVARARWRTGRGVVFLSDTSLPEVMLADLLAREGLFVAGDLLYTSARWGASKQDGALFDVVAADLGVAGADVEHTGDDRWSDLAHARLRGWHATLDTRAHLTGREHRLDAASAATGGLGPRLAGASRMGRLAAAHTGDDADLAAVAGGVALPLLASFGLWVLGQARLLGLDRLYFVARDGEVFLEVTRRLAAQASDPIDCRYLYGSRRAWQLAAAGTAAHGNRQAWLPDDLRGEALSAREVLALSDISPADAHARTGLDLVGPGRADTPLGADGWAELQRVLAAAPLRTEVRDRARRRRDLLVRYLDQEGVTAPGRVGLVDVGWTGRAARAFEDVLADAGRPLPSAYLFLGLLGSAPEIMGQELHARSQGWLLDAPRGRGLPPGAAEDPVMLIESFAMGREGHTTGYAVDGDAVVPELVSAVNAATATWAFGDYRAGLARALDALVDGPAHHAGVDMRPLVWRQLLDFWRHPSGGEAAAWGAQPYSEDFHNATSSPLATPITLRRLLTRLGLGPPAWRQPTFWLAGTLAVSPEPWRRLLLAAGDGQLLAARLRRVPRRLRAERAIRRPPRP